MWGSEGSWEEPDDGFDSDYEEDETEEQEEEEEEESENRCSETGAAGSSYEEDLLRGFVSLIFLLQFDFGVLQLGSGLRVYPIDSPEPCIGCYTISF